MKTILRDLGNFTIGIMALTGAVTWVVIGCSFINIIAG